MQKEMDRAVNRRELGTPAGETIYGKTVCQYCISLIPCLTFFYRENISFYCFALSCIRHVLLRSVYWVLEPSAMNLPRG
jgi:hypothetical protein